jgi:hypothetical protein
MVRCISAGSGAVPSVLSERSFPWTTILYEWIKMRRTHVSCNSGDGSLRLRSPVRPPRKEKADWLMICAVHPASRLGRRKDARPRERSHPPTFRPRRTWRPWPDHLVTGEAFNPPSPEAVRPRRKESGIGGLSASPTNLSSPRMARRAHGRTGAFSFTSYEQENSAARPYKGPLGRSPPAAARQVADPPFSPPRARF